MIALRGAITVADNTAEAIREATCELLQVMSERNRLAPDEIVSVFFTMTPDLNACFPAWAARAGLGWNVPMMDMVEVDVPGALPKCLRVLAHVDRAGPGRHTYLRDARALRPDLAE